MALGDTIDRELKAQERDQLWLAEQVGVTQSAVSKWVLGKSIPEPHHVFAIERALGRDPGSLSRPLGYVPADAAPALTIEQAIEASDLDVRARNVLLATLHSIA